MTYTANHHLPQWEEADRVRMEDFNDAMGQLETELNGQSAALKKQKSELEARLGSADSALVDLTAKLGTGHHNCRISWGKYVGNSTTYPVRFNFDFFPVLFFAYNEYTMNNIQPQFHIRDAVLRNVNITLTWGDNWVQVDTYNTVGNLNNGNVYYVCLGYDLAEGGTAANDGDPTSR